VPHPTYKIFEFLYLLNCQKLFVNNSTSFFFTKSICLKKSLSFLNSNEKIGFFSQYFFTLLNLIFDALDSKRDFNVHIVYIDF